MYSQKLYRVFVASVLSLGILVPTGCKMGPNSPGFRHSVDMLRVERDAAEDEYYNLKQKHDEALWKIEDLETQIKSIQEESNTRGVSYDQLDPIDDLQQGGFNTSFKTNEVSAAEFQSNEENAEFVEPGNSPVSKVIPEGDSEVSYVDVDPSMTKGFDSHGKSGDDGIVVAVRPMDASDQFVPVAAPITISLIDPARSGIRQRVGLWKFTAQQVANRIDFDNKAFLFRLPWQRTAPIHSDLKLFIRFEANDGKRETEMDLPVVLDGAPKSRWTKLEADSTTPESLVEPPKSTFTMRESNSEPSGEWTVLESDPNSSQMGSASSGSAGSSPSVQIARPEWSPYR